MILGRQPQSPPPEKGKRRGRRMRRKEKMIQEGNVVTYPVQE